MPEAGKVDSGVIKVEGDRLAVTLIARGLVTRDEVLACRARSGIAGPEALLTHLVESGSLTQAQANRLFVELPSLVGQGQQIPGYQVMEKLGQGAMGTVYRAKQVSMNRFVALKILPPRLASSPKFLEHFTREAHTAAKLSHNNIVQAIDVGSAGTIHYFVMELVEGKTIKDELETGRVYEEKEALEIVVQIAQALQHAHRRGLIHRDIKPANILVTAEGVAKLADLGLARETDDKALSQREKGLSIGTPFYMSPEQIEGRTNVDGRADIYALGATLYHMVTGQPPFPGKRADEVMQAHLDQELTPPDHLVPDLSAGLGAVVETMMAKERRKRYQQPDQLIIDLECLLNDEPPKLTRKSASKRARAALEDLAADEAESEPEPEEEEFKPRRRKPKKEGKPQETRRLIWMAALGSGLVISVVLNIVLLIFRR
jgi:eukaryotic-like serine/threonine-protein kinase